MLKEALMNVLPLSGNLRLFNRLKRSMCIHVSIIQFEETLNPETPSCLSNHVLYFYDKCLSGFVSMTSLKFIPA